MRNIKQRGLKTINQNRKHCALIGDGAKLYKYKLQITCYELPDMWCTTIVLIIKIECHTTSDFVGQDTNSFNEILIFIEKAF